MRFRRAVPPLGCLKYFKEDFPEYDVAVAGSLLGISIHRDQSFPVGMVELIRMFPMSLHEFLNATGNKKGLAYATGPFSVPNCPARPPRTTEGLILYGAVGAAT